jgi:hypothetical protein
MDIATLGERRARICLARLADLLVRRRRCIEPVGATTQYAQIEPSGRHLINIVCRRPQFGGLAIAGFTIRRNRVCSTLGAA